MGTLTTAMHRAEQITHTRQRHALPAAIAKAMALRPRTATSNPDKSARRSTAAPAAQPAASQATEPAADQSCVLRAAARTRAQRRAQTRTQPSPAVEAQAKDDADYKAAYGADATTFRPQSAAEPVADDALYSKLWRE